MKLITRNTDYAIRALCFIAQEKGRVVTVSELVRELKIPRPFLRKILQALNKDGVLRSYRGQGGGFRLAAKPDNIFLVDLIEAFQGPISLNECFFKKDICPRKARCRLQKKIKGIEDDVISELKSISLTDLLR